MIAVIVFIVHSLDEEILINQKDVPDVIIGDIVEIYHIEDEERWDWISEDFLMTDIKTSTFVPRPKLK